jgi:spermidine/putrescine transport system substrate-binding protein
MVRVMRRQGLLRPLDKANLPNLAGLAPEVTGHAFDPDNSYSVPYKWGVTGIGYNRKLVRKAPESWADLLEPDRLKPYEGLVSMLDDQREVIGAALVYLGLSNNSTNPEDLARAAAVLRAQKPFVAKYDSSAYYQSLASGEIALALGYSQEIALAQQDNPDIEFAIPKEGATFYLDNLAIPTTSKHPAAAEQFINFILRPEISARIANFTQGPSPVAAAKAMIDPAVLGGIAYRLPPQGRQLLIDDVGEAESLYNDVWTELKGR